MAFSQCKLIPTPVVVNKREMMGSCLTESLLGHRLASSQSLFKRDLHGHYGCVNAIEFSSDGQLIASGGDDRRLLLWNVGQTIFDDKHPHVIDTLHISNINSCCFDADNRKVSTGGNDGQVIVHDINVRQSSAVYGLSDAVYCLSPDPINATIMAAATGDGKAHILDLRVSIDTAPFVLADQGSAMHSIMYNPAEPRLLATANSKHGIGLWDIRKPLKCIHYKTSVQNCMSVRFNSRGDQLLALRRRSSPVLYDIGKMHPIYEFDYKTYYNACTLKSCSFAGLRDEYVMSGSDDFCIYLWKVPTHISDNYVQSEPHMILKGHRSIVNQVRYCPINQAVISSGVEKLIKLWSPYHIPGCTGRLTHSRRYGDDDEVERNAYSHEEYIHMVLQAGSFLSHDYTNGSIEEEPCMIAFFDSLIQREIEQSIEEDDTLKDPSVGSSDDDVGGPEQEVNGSGLLATDSEDASNTRDTTTSSSSRLEDSSRPFFLDLESSSDSEGEVDIILSAMYTRYMTARERSMSTGLRPSGKKISSVIAKGKQKEHPIPRKSQPRKVQRMRKSMHHTSDQFMQENTANMNILVDAIDNFVDNLVARESSTNQTLSDTSDGHVSTDSGSNVRGSSSSPVEVDQHTATLDIELHSASLQPGPRQSTIPDDAVTSLEPGMYFMPELQAFAPESFIAVANLNWSPDPSWSGRTPASSRHDFSPSGQQGSGPSLNVRRDRTEARINCSPSQPTTVSSNVSDGRTSSSNSSCIGSRTGSSNSSCIGGRKSSSNSIGGRTSSSNSSCIGGRKSSNSNSIGGRTSSSNSNSIGGRTSSSNSSCIDGRTSSSNSSCIGGRTSSSNSSCIGGRTSSSNSNSIGGRTSSSNSSCIGGRTSSSKSTVIHKYTSDTQTSVSNQVRYSRMAPDAAETVHKHTDIGQNGHCIGRAALQRADVCPTLNSSSSSSCVTARSSTYHFDSAPTTPTETAIDTNNCQHTTPDINTGKPANVQFKKVKVAGKRFRVRCSKSRSSSDEDK